LAAILAYAALAPVASAGAAAAWLAPLDAGQPDSPAYLDVGMTPGGEVLTLWRGYEGAYGVRAAERPAEGPLGAPRELLPAGAVIENLGLTMNSGGEAIAVWRRPDGPDIRLQYSVRAPGGSFSAGKFGSPAGANVASPVADIDDAGNAIAVWARAPGDFFVRYAARPAGGEFGAVGAVANESGRSPQVAVDGSGNATVIWARDELAQPDAIRVATRSPGGSFSIPSTISAELDALFANPQLVVNGAGAAVAAWVRDDASGDQRVEVALRAPGGSFAPPVEVSPDGVDSGLPRIGIDYQGNVLVAWRNLGTDTVQLASGTLGGGLGPTTTISGPGAGALDLAMNADGRAAVVWTEGLAGPSRVWAIVKAPGGPFGPAAPVSASGPEALGPLVSIDAEGNAVAAWRSRATPGDFATERTTIAGYDAVAPRFTGLDIPASGEAGAALGFAATAFDVWGPVSIGWELGDGTAANGSPVSHRYADPGGFGVQASATDAAGFATVAGSTVGVVDSAVRMRILGKRLRLSRSRVAWLRLRCLPAEASPPCRGKVRLRTRGRVRFGGKRRRAVLAKATFRVPAGRTKRVKLRLGKRKARLVRGSRRARRVVAIAAARDGAGNRAKPRRRLLLAPTGKRKGKAKATRRTLAARASAAGKAAIYVPQAGRFSVRPETLRFAYQPPDSHGDEEPKGRGLYPPFRITGLEWRRWHLYPVARAVASGWLHYDSCEPDCLHGRYLRVRARVELDGSSTCFASAARNWTKFDRVWVTPRGGPTRKRFIQCTGKVRSGRKSTAIPAGVGFNR
jgi:hypothetical protein